MTGRMPFGLLLSLTVLVCWPIQAQDQGGPPPGYYGVQPAGFHSLQDNAAGQYQAVPDYSYQLTPGPQMPGPAPRMVYEQLPDDLGFGDPDTPLGNWLTDTFRHSWFRGEYLLWNISGPGGTLLGAQTSDGVPNAGLSGAGYTGFNIINATNNAVINVNGQTPTTPIGTGVVYPMTVNGVSGFSQSPTMANTYITGLSGFRDTYGLPMPVGQVELGGFVLGTSLSTFNTNTNLLGENLIQPQIPVNNASSPGSSVGTNGLPATNGQFATFVSQALTTNGVAQPFASATFINYDVSYHYQMRTAVWGTEANYVADSADPQGFFHLKPILGFRYLSFRDRLNQGGQYNQANATNPTAPATVVSREIDSASNNNLYGPQIGLRMEYAQPQFALGFEPKLMTALNTYTQSLATSNILSSTDPAQSILQSSTTFCPIVDLKAYGNLSLSKFVSFYMSYNFLYVADVNRSYNDVQYNVNGTTNQSAFALQKTLTNVTLQGISVGFDIRY